MKKEHKSLPTIELIKRFCHAYPVFSKTRNWEEIKMKQTRPVLTFGCESWKLNKEELRNKIVMK